MNDEYSFLLARIPVFTVIPETASSVALRRRASKAAKDSPSRIP